MCYSAQIRHDYQRFVREFGAQVDLQAFARLYWERAQGHQVRTARAMDLAFGQPRTALEREIQAMVQAHDAARMAALEELLFRQRRRLADAERRLQVRSTRQALEERRIATAKVERALEARTALRRTTPTAEDARIYPGWYAPVLVREGGRRVLKPMRYQCRPCGKPADFDRRFPGTYNARRDNLEKFWRDQFGATHGLVVMDAFYENVALHRVEQRPLAAGEAERNLVLEFRPDPPRPMLVACLWSHWTAPGASDLHSFAAITDTPPVEVAAAGHDRCVIPIRAEHIDAWLEPDPSRRAAQQAILDDRERPFYAHREAA